MSRNDENKKWFCTMFSMAVWFAFVGTAQAGWPQQAKLLASDGDSNDYFGISVSISGDYAIVGADRDEEKGACSGSAYIFKRDGANWFQQQKLTASDGEPNEFFGESVSINNDYSIVGASEDDEKGYYSGSVYIFKRNGTAWIQQQKLTALDETADDRFGFSVSISGDYIIVGMPGDDDKGSGSGSAYIFKWDGTAWIQQQKLTASDGATWDLFGSSVSICGNYAIVGAYWDDDNGTNSGSAYIFKWDGTSWAEQQKIIAIDGADDDEFGWGVSIDGNYAIIGAHYDDDKGTNSGSVYIFKLDGTSWSQQQKLLASDGAASNFFGREVSISGDSAIVGTYYTNGAYIFMWNGTSWIQQLKLSPADGYAYFFGYSVSISGNSAIVGAFADDDKGTASGSAYIFQRETGTPTLLDPNGGEELIAGTTYTVNWQTQGTIDNILIEYSINNGTDWKIINTVANTGSYQWIVPQENSQQCLVRVSDAACPSANDISDNTFRIYTCTLVSDLNHDCFVDFFDFSLLALEWLKCGDPCDPNCQP